MAGNLLKHPEICRDFDSTQSEQKTFSDHSLALNSMGGQEHFNSLAESATAKLSEGILPLC